MEVLSTGEGMGTFMSQNYGGNLRLTIGLLSDGEMEAGLLVDYGGA